MWSIDDKEAPKAFIAVQEQDFLRHWQSLYWHPYIKLICCIKLKIAILFFSIRGRPQLHEFEIKILQWHADKDLLIVNEIFKHSCLWLGTRDNIFDVIG